MIKNCVKRSEDSLLYNKQDKYLKKNKKKLFGEDVAKETDLVNCKYETSTFMNTTSITTFFILIYSKLWLYSNKARPIFILGTIAEKSFRNLRNEYGREKRKWKVTNRSDVGAGEIKRPYILD